MTFEVGDEVRIVETGPNKNRVGKVVSISPEHANPHTRKLYLVTLSDLPQYNGWFWGDDLRLFKPKTVKLPEPIASPFQRGKRALAL